MNWIILTGEYPPSSGGVSDYTKLIGEGLAACGDAVHVYAPPVAGQQSLDNSAVRLHRLTDHFGRRGLAELEAQLAAVPKPRRILVQYVPHAYGSHAMNIQFCRWVRRLAGRGESFDVMFHEVAYPLEKQQRLRHRFLAHVTRWMARSLGNSADRIFVSIPAWERMLNQLRVNRPMIWSPIPSTVSQSPDANAVAAVRERFGGATLVGHFGTYGKRISANVAESMTLLSQRDSTRKFMMLGRGGEGFVKQLIVDVPSLQGRMFAPGLLDAQALSDHLAACDVMVQPYGDGVSSRRTSVMAALALGVPIVTSIGPLTEPLWVETNAVALAASSASTLIAAETEMLLSDREKRTELGARAKTLYREKFDVKQAVAAIQDGFSGTH